MKITPFIRRLGALAARALAIWLAYQTAFGARPFPDLGPAQAAPGESSHAVKPDSQPLREGQYVGGEIIVKFKGAATPASVASALARRSLEAADAIPGTPVFKVRVPVGKEVEHAIALGRDVEVEYAEPNYLAMAFWTPNDTYYSSYQWNMAKIGMPAAWDSTRGSSSIKVAVIDTGIDTTHPDRPANLILDHDYVDGDENPYDENNQEGTAVGHGTHVAGIVGAATNNGRGVAGVAPGVTVVVLRGLNSYGVGNNYRLALAIRRAADLGVKVMNMSWGSFYEDQTLKDAIDYAYGKGVLLVAAAGNSGSSAKVYPAAYPNVMAVAATGADDEQAPYSETGSWISVAAPGGNSPSRLILSTIPLWTGYSYRTLSGTSMAAPHVAGLAGLLFSANPQLSNAQVRGMIENTAVDLGTIGKDNFFGFGRIDAAAAVRAVPLPLQVGASSLAFMLRPTEADQWSQSVSISSGGGAALSWTASNLSNSAWLSFSPGSGTTPGSLTVTVNKAGLSQGWREGYVRISAAGASNSPQDVKVSLYVGPVQRIFLPAIAKNSN